MTNTRNRCGAALVAAGWFFVSTLAACSAPPEADPAASVSSAVDVQRALLGVPEEFRSVLVMHDALDMAYDDIADVLGIPTGTVKSRLHRGRVALARLLPGERSEHSQPSEGTITT